MVTLDRNLRSRRDVLRAFDARASRRAIYVDYEGNKYASPTLLGWQVEGVYQAAIVEPDFATCAQRARAREPVSFDHEAAVRALLKMALDEDRCIVSWSLHDLKQMSRVLGRVSRKRLLERYVNALDLARPWHRNTWGNTAPGGASLAYFARLFDVRIPTKYGEHVVGSNLSALHRRFREGHTYGSLEPDDRTRWVTIVKHNKWDLRTMEKIVGVLAGPNAKPTLRSEVQPRLYGLRVAAESQVTINAIQLNLAG